MTPVGTQRETPLFYLPSPREPHEALPPLWPTDVLTHPTPGHRTRGQSSELILMLVHYSSHSPCLTPESTCTCRGPYHFLFRILSRPDVSPVTGRDRAKGRGAIVGSRTQLNPDGSELKLVGRG